MLFEEVLQYMNKNKEERQKHLCLSDSCIEIGGNSKDFRGLLAHFLKTTIPYKTNGKCCLCHACHNEDCSNPKHLYWGTYSENCSDFFLNGGKKSFTYTYSELRNRGISKALRNKPKSQESKIKNSISNKLTWAKKKADLA